jgi:hypothetical protein
MDHRLTVPISETLTLTRYDAKIKDFVRNVGDRHFCGELEFKIEADDGKFFIVIYDANEICRGLITPLGIYGFYNNPDHKPDEPTPDEPTPDEPTPDDAKPANTDTNFKGELIHHWNWIWTLPEEHTVIKTYGPASPKILNLKKKFETIADDPNPTTQAYNNTLKTMFANPGLFSDDPMIISYIQSVLLEQLNFDMIYNIEIDNQENVFISLGVSGLVWYDPVITADIVQDEDDE